MEPLQRITERVSRNGHPDQPGTPIYLLTIEEFFDGNVVDGSICCNLYPMPSPARVRGILDAIVARPDVSDLRVQITAFDDPAWPFSDTIWVVTTASESEVASWFPEDLAPNEVWEGWQISQAYEPCPIPKGSRIIACWWD